MLERALARMQQYLDWFIYPSLGQALKRPGQHLLVAEYSRTLDKNFF